MRPMAIAALCCALQGCFFFYYRPSSTADQRGNACIAAGYFTGDKIKSVESGKTGVVDRVYGASERCRNASYPNLADVSYD